MKNGIQHGTETKTEKATKKRSRNSLEFWTIEPGYFNLILTLWEREQDGDLRRIQIPKTGRKKLEKLLKAAGALGL